MVNLIIYKHGLVLELGEGKTLTVGATLTESIFKLYLRSLSRFSIYIYDETFIESCGTKKVKLFDAVKSYSDYWTLGGLPFSFKDDVSIFDLFAFYCKVKICGKQKALEILEQVKECLQPDD